MVGKDEAGHAVTALKDGPFTRNDIMTFDAMLCVSPRHSDEIWHVRQSGVFSLSVPPPPHPVR